MTQLNSTSPIHSLNASHQNSISVNKTELNSNAENELPIDMQFNDGHLLAVVVYSFLMVISAVGNISVFSTILRLRLQGKLSQINLFLFHLAIADLLVTFLMMPLEIAWNITVSWQANDMMCRIMSFFRIFGLYLSGFVLVCISLDRYLSVMKPLTSPDTQRIRGRLMLLVAWITSIIVSLPQAFIFHVESHPHFTWYKQCITFNSFPSVTAEKLYNFSGFFFLYVFPMIMIIFCYSCILLEMTRVNARMKSDETFRRSNIGALGRAKIRTLQMSVIIVAAFFFCWTPYNVMSLWYWIDKESALAVDQRIQKGFFIFACTNSCVNPIIYGLFHFRSKKPKRRVEQTNLTETSCLGTFSFG
ncbi:unnamed protein product [Orchesella dallaii]|uniref:G-protein coupled receptors family 1 profile domain-containing protein n=1 Tax=Orchesella dallaii TaxID=48710 RepID=A0ABP1S9F7_9HEXA